MIFTINYTDGEQVDVDTNELNELFTCYDTFTEWYEGVEERADEVDDAGEDGVRVASIGCEYTFGSSDNLDTNMVEQLFMAESAGHLEPYTIYVDNENYDVEYSTFEDAYRGEYDSFGAFAREHCEYIDHVLARYVDWEAYAEGELGHDFYYESGHVFQNL